MPIGNAAVPGDIVIYVRLIWLFVFVITALMLCLGFLYISKRRAQEREHLGFDFSLSAIEGLESERQRVACDLHDTVLPLVRGDPEVSGLLRSICLELMPPDFTRLSLNDCLAGLCGQFARRTNIECACLIEDDVDFSPIKPGNRLHIYRIIQESFTNIEKHSRSSKASLVVRRLSRQQFTRTLEKILVCVSDDGKGLAGGEGEGLGMKSIRQRAAILGAALDFKSESGHGLMVRVEIPLEGN